MLPQNLLPYQYQSEKIPSNMTTLAGLLPYLDLAYKSGLMDSIERNVDVRPGNQGWKASEIILSLICLNIVGGDAVSDISRLEQDRGLRKLIKWLRKRLGTLSMRRERDARFRKPTHRAFPSPTAIFDYLSRFHNAEEEESRRTVTGAFIPAANNNLKGLSVVEKDLIGYSQACKPEKIATLDHDATLVETYHSESTYCYKGYKAYQPLNLYWFEKDLIIHSEFRDGNVPAGYDEKRTFEEGLSRLPVGVEKVYLRADTAGYQHELLDYCAKGENPRFGVIEFAIGANVTPSLKEAVLEVKKEAWHSYCYQDEYGSTVVTNQEWAEIAFVPNWLCYSKDAPYYRYLAIREPLEEEKTKTDYPFPTIEMETKQRYKLFAMVTNRDLPGDELITWHRERCGKSEEVHHIQKEELAGGHLPSHLFGTNAAWWSIMIITFNLISIMKHCFLGEGWGTARPKKLRYHLIYVAARVIIHGRQCIVRLGADPAINARLLAMRVQLLTLGQGPPD